MLGRQKADYTQRHSAGVHSFTFVGGSAQAYLLAVHNDDQRQVFKVLQKTRNTERPGISYMQEAPAVASVQTVKKSKAVFPWYPGDALHITGFATLPGSGTNADTIILSPFADTLLTFVFPHEVLPSVVTAPVTNITYYTAEGGGTVTDTGNAAVTVRGICWSTQPNPTIADNHTVDSAGLGNFISFITGLGAGVSYYLRAYATNLHGTAYGNEIVFSTIAIPCGLPFTDTRDGNIYNTILLADQCWMRDNLRYLPAVFPGDNPNQNHPRYYVYGYMGTDTAIAKQQNLFGVNIYDTYGVLYNWPAVMQGSNSSNTNPSGVQGICPPGWHVPSEYEWMQLEIFLGIPLADIYLLHSRGTNEGAKLAGADSLWESGPLINNPGFGSSGFDAFPAGFVRPNTNKIFWNLRSRFTYWTATNGPDATPPPQPPYFQANRAIVRHMSNASTTGQLIRTTSVHTKGLSLRCVRD